MPNILFLKAESDDNSKSGDLYAKYAQEKGFNFRFLPILQFIFVNQEALKAALQRPDDYAALVFTSPRSIEAVSRVKPELETVFYDLWASKRCFVVGPATAKKAQEAWPSSTILGSEAGQAKSLVNIIAEAVDEGRVEFFPIFVYATAII